MLFLFLFFVDFWRGRLTLSEVDETICLGLHRITLKEGVMTCWLINCFL